MLNKEQKDLYEKSGAKNDWVVGLVFIIIFLAIVGINILCRFSDNRKLEKMDHARGVVTSRQTTESWIGNRRLISDSITVEYTPEGSDTTCYFRDSDGPYEFIHEGDTLVVYYEKSHPDEAIISKTDWLTGKNVKAEVNYEAALIVSVFPFGIGLFFFAEELAVRKNIRKGKFKLKKSDGLYPDDTFTYVGHSTVSMGVTSPSCISLESENFPHVDVQIYEVDGNLYSNYPLYYHKEAVTEYFSDLIISCFRCDYVELEMTDTADKPLKYVSDEKYIEKYAIHHYIAYVYYEDGHAYPDEDELAEMALDYFRHITTDNDGQGNEFRLCFVRPGGSKKHNDLDMDYTFRLHDGVASLYNDKEKSYVFKGPLEDLI